MSIRLRKTVRLLLLLLIACSTFMVGSAAFHFYAAASAFLFTPKQTTPETTQTLMTRAAPPPIYQPAFTFSMSEYEPVKFRQPVCDNCVQDKDCGLCMLLSGEYVNHSYMYSLKIPAEVQAMETPPPAPAHGFMARVLADQEALIYVDGSYDSAFLNSTDKAVSEEINYLKEDYGESVVVLERESARLGKRPATRYRVQYTNNSTGLTMIAEGIIALRKYSLDEDELGIIYTATLRTPIYSQKQSHELFEKILKSWRELETDDD
jgi:hypothetical protein